MIFLYLDIIVVVVIIIIVVVVLYNNDNNNNNNNIKGAAKTGSGKTLGTILLL